MTAVLHSYFRSSTSTRLRVALNLKQVSYEYVGRNIRAGMQKAQDYLSIHPQGLVPALEVDGNKLFQSLAIVEYLEEQFPHPPLLPHDPAGRARVRALALMIACEVHPLNNLRVLNHIRAVFGANEEQVGEWFRHWVAETFDNLEAYLAAHSDTGEFCHGDTPTLADICLYAQVLNNQRFNISSATWPTIARIFRNCEELEAFRAAAPAHQPDADGDARVTNRAAS